MPAIEQVEATIADALRSGSVHDAARAVMLLIGPRSESDARNAKIAALLDRTPGRPADLAAAIAAVDGPAPVAAPSQQQRLLQALSAQLLELSGDHGRYRQVTREILEGLGMALNAMSK